jgi:hypothetical protein
MQRLMMILSTAAVLAFAGLAQAGSPNPVKDIYTAPAKKSVSYTMKFYGNQPAVASVLGDGATYLDLFVYDAAGNLVASRISASTNEIVLVRWTPAWTGTFRIVVVNTGSTWNRYSFMTN